MNYKKIIIGCAIGLLAVGAGIFSVARTPGQKTAAVLYPETETQPEELTKTEEAFATQEDVQPVYVYVCGAVVLSGLYELKTGDRIYDAVCAAGGMTSEADADAVNLAAAAQDGQKIYIPYQGESYTEDGTAEAFLTADGKININTADVTLLMSLPGIGEAKAEAIAAYRTEHGSFLSTEEIMNVSGIKESSYAKIKDLICID